jgi:phage FluMu protein Com
VPVAVFKDCDEWRIRVLSDEEIQRARAASDWMARGFCPRCERVREGREEDCGSFSETHLPGRCPRCKALTEAMTLEPSSISRSASDREWYVVVLDDDELAHVRLGIPFPNLLCSWTS